MESNLGHLIFNLPSGIKTLIRKIEKNGYKLNASEEAIIFNQTCLKEGLLPK